MLKSAEKTFVFIIIVEENERHKTSAYIFRTNLRGHIKEVKGEFYKTNFFLGSNRPKYRGNSSENGGRSYWISSVNEHVQVIYLKKYRLSINFDEKLDSCGL